MSTEVQRFKCQISGHVRLISKDVLSDGEVIVALWDIVSSYATQDYWGRFSIYWAIAAFVKESSRLSTEEVHYYTAKHQQKLVTTTYHCPKSDPLKLKTNLTGGVGPKVIRLEERKISTSERVNVGGFSTYAVLDIQVSILSSTIPLDDADHLKVNHMFEEIKDYLNVQYTKLEEGTGKLNINKVDGNST